MRHRVPTSIGALAAVIAALLLGPVPAASQATSSVAKPTAPARTSTPPRTPDGQPDLQGVWGFATLTPLERPNDLAGKPFFTEQEAAEYEKRRLQEMNMDRRDGPPEADVSRAYNNFWWDRGTKVVSTRQTSLIVDPPDGRIPPLTSEAQTRAAVRAEARKLHPADGPESRSLAERCILWGTAGPPMLPSAYNNNFQLFQTREHVVILNEMIHDARVVPLDGRPHLPQNIRQLMGDSRGHWESNTLVVDTTNFTDKTNFRGAGENLHLIERFTRVEADTLLYEVTVDDPTSFTKPWTVKLPMWRNPDHLFEYACHEGNYGMFGILSAARAEEKAAEEAAKKGSK